MQGLLLQMDMRSILLMQWLTFGFVNDHVKLNLQGILVIDQEGDENNWKWFSFYIRLSF